MVLFLRGLLIVSAKVNDGLNWEPRYGWFIKRPLPLGSWFLDSEFLEDLGTRQGWGWMERHDKEYGGAILVAPSPIILWDE